MINLYHLNLMNKETAINWFMQTCTAPHWCELMTQTRPYDSIEQICEYATIHWEKMQNNDFLAAFQGHPMIGDIHSLQQRYAATKTVAGNEQAGATNASEAILQALQQANKDYLAKHGFIFIICASGLSAETMLEALRSRITNNTATEIKIAAEEQLKITLLRIQKALSDTTKATPSPKEARHE